MPFPCWHSYFYVIPPRYEWGGGAAALGDVTVRGPNRQWKEENNFKFIEPYLISIS